MVVSSVEMIVSSLEIAISSAKRGKIYTTINRYSKPYTYYMAL